MTLRSDASNPKPAGADFSDMLQDALTTANACFMAGTRMTGLASAIAGSESLIPDPRSREKAALDIAVKALAEVQRATAMHQEMRFMPYLLDTARNALTDIITIMGDSK